MAELRLAPVVATPINRTSIDDPAARLAFCLAGSAVFTVENPETGKRFTYKIRRGKATGQHVQPRHFAYVLTGPDNRTDYEYLGFLDDGRVIRCRSRLTVPDAAPSLLAFQWLWSRIYSLRDITPAVLYHHGRCGRCGRLLTVPESIRSGVGPECAKKV